MADEVVYAKHTGGHAMYLSGPAGAGKTTIAIRRLIHLLDSGVPAEQCIVLLPQRTLSTPYRDALQSPETRAGGQVDILTIGGLARRTLDLFWPLVPCDAGFGQPGLRPRFLTLETTQYFMDLIVEPTVAYGAFDGITISRSRLASQIIDNMNKAAAVGFPLDEISERLKTAWSGESSRHRIYDQVQQAAVDFRNMCLADNRLDWSLQMETFRRFLLPLPHVQRYLLGGYRHLIADNVEEDIPVAHDLLLSWLPLCESALIVEDADGGYRVFLGADPTGARALAEHCHQESVVAGSHVMSPEVAAFGKLVSRMVGIADGPADTGMASAPAKSLARRALVTPDAQLSYHPQMLDWVAEKVSHLVTKQDLPRGEIAILAPFVSDALRFSLSERLARFGIPVRTHRPSREVGEEPAARCLLTLAKLAHPEWRRAPHAADVTQSLSQAIEGLDPVRAHLLVRIVYGAADKTPSLLPFHEIRPEMQERISYILGSRYDELRNWIQDYGMQSAASSYPEQLTFFLSRLFGELLSQPGFGFHGDFDRGAAAAGLIESVRKFWQGLDSPSRLADQQELGAVYVDMVDRGVVSALSLSSWALRPEDAVLLVPAHTFLMLNQAVSVQFWLEAGSAAWSERIYQPLTHPLVMRRDWPAGKKWTDDDETRARREALARLVLGLSRRCRRGIYLAYSDLNERGYEQHGPLLQAVQQLLRGQQGEAL